jgi:hypothetical protein
MVLAQRVAAMVLARWMLLTGAFRLPVPLSDPAAGSTKTSSPSPVQVLVVPPVETPPVETPPVETPPVETPPVETPPVETPPVETPPVETPPVETPPVETPPVETPPVETPPVETPPVETPPVDVRPDEPPARPFPPLSPPLFPPLSPPLAPPAPLVSRWDPPPQAINTELTQAKNPKCWRRFIFLCSPSG